MPIQILPDYLANQIAAGEVVERPASVVKELVENSLDAGATSVVVRLEESGLRRIEVQDDGHGIPYAELPLALARHATSKITSTEGLFNIHTFGFRGEALPSIASVARLTLTSRAAGAEETWQITPEGELKPAALPHGTRIEVEDLFYATPARRKFLKSARSESIAVRDVLEKLALAHPAASFSLWEDGRETLHFGPEQGNLWQSDAARFSPRVASLLGGDFAAESLALSTARATAAMALSGVISAPQRHVGVAQQVYLFVNNRPVKDRSLVAAVRQAYGDALPKGRHPQGILMLTLAPEDVDVNVHPAKSEVRFKDAGSVFGFLFASIRQALGQTEAAPTSQDLRIGTIQTAAFNPLPTAGQTTFSTLAFATPPSLLRKGEDPSNHPIIQSSNHPEPEPEAHPLGAALGQIASSFIVASTANGDLVLVDQHAAHERLVYESLKKSYLLGSIPSQPLLLPLPIPLTTRAVSTLLEHAEALQNWGLFLSPHSPTSIMAEALPALLGDTNPLPLLQDLAAELEALGTRQTLQNNMEKILSTFACHHSVRANRRLSLAEQNQLLRDIETTPAAQTCNHGRPTVRLLKASELAALFER